MLTNEDLDAITKLDALATPGPWRAHDTWLDHGGITATVLSGEGNETEGRAWLFSFSHDPQARWQRNVWNNAQFIAAARTLMPELLAEIKELRAKFHQTGPATESTGIPASNDAASLLEGNND